MTGFRFFFLFFATTLLSACAIDRTFGAADSIQITELTQLPAPAGQVSYVIGPREKLEIQVVGANELSGTFLTNDEGNIAFPFLNEVSTAGLSADEAAAVIAAGLQDGYLRNPQVRIVPEELTPQTISIGGQVERPGSYPAKSADTLLRLVNLAEGLGQYAKHDDVLIMRRVEGQNYIGVYNIGAIQRGNYADPELYPNDIVMVGDSPGRRRLDNVLQFVPLLSTTTILIDRLGR